MIPLLLAVVSASVLGSLHCAGMCGPLGAALLPRGGRRSDRARVQAAWHLGRLVVYTALGALVGAAGAAIDLGFSALAIQGVMLRITAVLVIAVGAISLLRRAGLRVPIHRVAAPSFVRQVVQRARGLPPIRRALMLGTGSALLPCGWLYAFVMAAAGTGSALFGSALMAAFWIGTVPALALAGEGGARLIRPLARRTPWLAEFAVVGVGLLLLLGRNPLPSGTVEQAAPAEASTATIAPSRLSPDEVGALDPSHAACCNDVPDSGN